MEEAWEEGGRVEGGREEGWELSRAAGLEEEALRSDLITIPNFFMPTNSCK